MLVTVSFSRCSKCGTVRHVSELIAGLEGKSICQDLVRCEQDKLKSSTAQSPSTRANGASTPQSPMTPDPNE